MGSRRTSRDALMAPGGTSTVLATGMRSGGVLCFFFFVKCIEAELHFSGVPCRELVGCAVWVAVTAAPSWLQPPCSPDARLRAQDHRAAASEHQQPEQPHYARAPAPAHAPRTALLIPCRLLRVAACAVGGGCALREQMKPKVMVLSLRIEQPGSARRAGARARRCCATTSSPARCRRSGARWARWRSCAQPCPTLI